MSYVASNIGFTGEGWVVYCDFCSNYEESTSEMVDYNDFRLMIKELGWRVYSYIEKGDWKYGYKCPCCIKEE